MKNMNHYVRSARAFAAISFFALLAMLSPLMTTTAHAQATWVRLQESNFRRDGDDPDRFVLKDNVEHAQDNDVIHLKIERVPELKNKVEIVLASSSNVRWWKGITIFKGIRAPRASYGVRYVRYRHIDTQDDDKIESSGTINISDLGDYSYLIFEKAKEFGAHTMMYQFSLTDQEGRLKYAGCRLTFTWERDG
ncbi:MAG: hypothetical protein LC754_08765 [Acidobacteria bacterium]|nr:hypothetical protein [Acidobacteriota bacterium]